MLLYRPISKVDDYILPITPWLDVYSSNKEKTCMELLLNIKLSCMVRPHPIGLQKGLKIFWLILLEINFSYHYANPDNFLQTVFISIQSHVDYRSPVWIPTIQGREVKQSKCRSLQLQSSAWDSE